MWLVYQNNVCVLETDSQEKAYTLYARLPIEDRDIVFERY